MEKVKFMPEGEEPVEYYILEKAKLGGFNYILVTDKEEGDADCWIMKEIPDPQDGDVSTYDMVTDDNELEVLTDIFSDLLSDVDIV